MQTYLRKRKRPTASVASRLTAASLSPTKSCLSPCTLANIGNYALASYLGVEKRRRVKRRKKRRKKLTMKMATMKRARARTRLLFRRR
ncbi:hypothetical protein GALMADRAFT_1207567 [Galerina marginata CBS 339.88]|uniref:Uncharacterized protein n=1 Tax=Galerina marginata (strain CBS 339.88) TaxID=685588 RepID=A0A067SHH3_GALM3|nr:hypothetical protein GALMADRAFT_1207567 [Galerina marginata CBS 339.88]